MPNRLACWLLSGLALFALAAPRARADSFTYTYTGTDFTNFGNAAGPDFPEFDGSDYLSATFTLSAPIDSEGVLTDYSADLISISMNAGELTLASGPNLIVNDLSFETTDGIITGWHIDLNVNSSYDPDWAIAQFVSSDSESFSADSAYVTANDPDVYPQNFGNESLDPGSFSEVGSVPEPATITMLVGGLLLLVSVRKRILSAAG